MRASVIIPTYNGAGKMLTILDSLQKQNVMPFEVIVVVDGSTDGTADIIRNANFDFAGFKLIEQENKGRAGVRNRGAKEASCELLVFADDDMVLPEDWLKNHIEHHIKYPNSLMSGRLEEMVIPGKGNSEFDVFEVWLNQRWNSGLKESSSETILLNTPYVTANNFSILRSDFYALQQFDERLRDAEDYDLAIKARMENYPLYLSKNSWAWHNDTSGKTFISYIKRLRQYNDAQLALIALKPEIYDDPVRNERYPKTLTGLKAAFFKLLSRRFFINSIDYLWVWLPVGVRCKIYDFIITANGVFFPRVPL